MIAGLFLRRFWILSIVFALGVTSMPASAQSPTEDQGGPGAIVFGADGMRQDIVQRYVDEHPDDFATFAEMLADGVSSELGMIPAAPPNTGAGWHSMASGAWAGETGTTNNTFHRNGAAFDSRTSALGSEMILTETAAQAWEKAGERVALVEWPGGRDAPIDGPVVDFRRFLSGRGVTTNFLQDEPLDDAGFIQAFGLQFDTNLDHPGLPDSGMYEPDPLYSGRMTAASLGWRNVPKSVLPARATRMRVLDFGEDKYGLNVLFLSERTPGSRPDYNRVIFDGDMNPSNGVVADLGPDEWGTLQENKVTIRGGSLDGKTAGYLFKVEHLETDQHNRPVYRLFHTSVTRANASWSTWPGEPGFDGDFEDFVADEFPVSTAADFAVLEAGVVSEETYVEQGLYWETGHFPILEYVAETYDPDIFFVGYPVTDEFQHQFLGLVTETVPSGDPNPAFDDFDLNGEPDGRIEEREGFIRRAYKGANDTLALTRELLAAGGRTDPFVFVGADHGFAPQFLALQGGLPLFELGLQSQEQTSNCLPKSATDNAKACWAGGTLQVYLRVAGRDAPSDDATAIQPEDYEDVRQQVMDAYAGITDPAHPTWPVIDSVYTKEEVRQLDDGAGGTINMLHPTRTGDVVVFSFPPYQWDAATPGELIAPSHFFGQHGYEPRLIDLDHNINLRSAFMLTGPGVRQGTTVENPRMIDVAPSLAFALGLPAPANASGQVRYDLFESSHQEVTLLNISDFHGQLEPLSESVDGISQRIGGLGFIDTYWDEAAAEAERITGSPAFRFAGGDSVGATPPLSAFLDDFPTIEAMNLAAFDADGIGNHNFDAGIERLEAHAAEADFPYVTANVFMEGTDERPEWAVPFIVRDFDGVEVAFIGFTNTDVPTLVNPTLVEDLEFRDPAPIVNQIAADLRADGVDAVVAFGHMGASECSDPFGRACSGPLIDLAGQLSGVDVLAGDHTNVQVNLVTSDADGNGILVTENLSLGARFTEIKLGFTDGELAYTTARWHRPWNIGVTPDAAIASLIDDLREALGPILNEPIGSSTVPIPRADACGNTAGRECESLEGNLVTDVLRTKYQVDFAFQNSGGLRADLTCLEGQDVDPSGRPCKNDASDFIIYRGQALAMLPFGNTSVTLEVDGAELKEILENGVSDIGGGRFIQLSGLRFEYDPEAPAGSRVLGASFFDGTEVGDAISFEPSATYSIAMNDFMAVGGDGYPDFSGRFDTRDILLNDVIEFIEANSPVSPEIQDRHIGDGAGEG